MNQISAENLKEIDRRFRTSFIVGLAQVAFTLVLAGVAWFIVSKTETVETNESVTTLWVAVLFIAVGSFVLRRLFFGWERLRNAALLGGVTGVLKLLQKNSLILGMFAEAISIIGFAITMFTGSSFDMFRAAAIALIVFIITFPRKKVWRAVVAGLQDV